MIIINWFESILTSYTPTNTRCAIIHKLDMTSTIKSYKQTNGDLKSLAAISMYVEDVAKKTNRICNEIVNVLANYDGAQLDLRQSDVSVDKSLVVQFFKVSRSARIYGTPGLNAIRRIFNNITRQFNSYAYRIGNII